MRLRKAEFKILQYLRDTPIFPERRGAIHLLVSGGKDSIALLEIFHRIQRLPLHWSGIELQLYLHHFNHKQRGIESDEDEILCREQAKSLGHPIVVNSWNTELESQLNEGQNFQAVARSWRYNTVRLFARELEHRSGDSNWVIATAHHRRDQAETMIQNITRGCGLSGLQGLSPWNHSTRLLRPLLCLPMDLVNSYIDGKSLPHREDSSNKNLDYTRNIIRHKTLAELEKINPKVVENFWSLSQDTQNAIRSNQMSGSANLDFLDKKPVSKTRTETAAIKSINELYSFVMTGTNNNQTSLTRQKLANILTHVHKLMANKTPNDSYIFALSPSHTLKIDRKYTEIIEK